MTVIFGNPGSTELPFLRDMPADFRYVLGLHERSAAGMALGYAMAKGAAVFVNLHSIASAGNGLSTLIDAYLGHVPLVDNRAAGSPAYSCGAFPRKPRSGGCEALREMGLRTAASRGCACGYRARVLPGDATSTGARISFDSHGRLDA